MKVELPGTLRRSRRLLLDLWFDVLWLRFDDGLRILGRRGCL
jgi:hypothetical protein